MNVLDVFASEPWLWLGITLAMGFVGVLVVLAIDFILWINLRRRTVGRLEKLEKKLRRSIKNSPAFIKKV